MRIHKKDWLMFYYNHYTIFDGYFVDLGKQKYAKINNDIERKKAKNYT